MPAGRAWIGVLLVMCPSVGLAEPAKRLHELFGRHDEWRLREFPEFAMSRGDYRFADRITDYSLAAIERRHAETRAFLDELRQIDRQSLSTEDQLNYDLFALDLQNAIEGHKFRTFLAPIGGRDGAHQTIAEMHERVRFRDATDFRNYVARLKQIPKMVDDVIALARLGMQEGRTRPRITLAGLEDQFRKLLGSEGRRGGLEALRTPLAGLERLSIEERSAIQANADEALRGVYAAVERLGEFVKSEYVPACRESIAASDWPDGQAWYAHQLAVMTTTSMSAREIHELGLREVARIRAEMMDVIRNSDFYLEGPAPGTARAELAALPDHELFARFIEYLRTDARFYHTSAEDLLAEYRTICKRVDPELARLFGRLPRLPYGVKEIPAFMAPVQTTAYYQPGDIRNAEPGWFYANTYDLRQRPRYEMISLAMHEAVPGHHLQIAIAQELENVPEFRRDAWITAFGEGWALYSERLGIEMGLYENPYDDFGRLLYEMWRACRLVVDPGMHALGWSRQQAIDFMLEHTALSELNIRNEVDRYISWPGQATAYKIGELKIRELRSRAESRLGTRFDIRAFHDVVLEAGPIPLSVLEQRVEAWIQAVAARPAESM